MPCVSGGPSTLPGGKIFPGGNIVPALCETQEQFSLLLSCGSFSSFWHFPHIHPEVGFQSRVEEIFLQISRAHPLFQCISSVLP